MVYSSMYVRACTHLPWHDMYVCSACQRCTQSGPWCLGAMCAQWPSVKVCIRAALHSCLPHSCVTTVMRVCIPSIVPPALFRCSVMPWVWRVKCRSCRKRTRGWHWRGRRTTWGAWLREMGRLRSYTTVWRKRPRHWHSWRYVPTHMPTRFVCACMCASNHMLVRTRVHTIVHIRTNM